MSRSMCLWKPLCGLLASAALTLLSACGGGDDAEDVIPPMTSACGVDAQKQFVWDTAQNWYLFLDLLPTSVDLAQFSTPEELLDSITATARSQEKDRHWSYISSKSEEQQLFGEGETPGFGFTLTFPIKDQLRLFVGQVYEGSAAAQAGFVRGEEITHIGTSVATLRAITSFTTSEEFNDAFGPSEPGVTRTFRVRTVAGATVDRTVTTTVFQINTVPVSTIFTRSGAGVVPKVGYVNLRLFIGPADAALREAFAKFQAENVEHVIVDLRYNGGGLVSVAELIASLLAEGHAGEVMYRTQLNSKHKADEETVLFSDEPQGISTVSIAFLTTEHSASASEEVINSLAPYANVAIIGRKTHGKPVGQFGFELNPSCDMLLRLVTFKTVDKNGHGDYFQGLPDANFSDESCAAPDDMARAQENPAEGMTKEALHWIDQNVCSTSSIALQKSRMDSARIAKWEHRMPSRPSPAQANQLGFH